MKRALVLLLAACNTPRPSPAEVAQKQQACAYQPGMLARDTTPAADPVGSSMPIDHIVLLMQENRSFDHYFSSFPGVDGASPDLTNPDSKGNLIKRFHFDSKCMPGGDHGWDAEHANLDGGKLDGFVKSNGDSPVPMGFYDESDLPYYYALARTFAISDRHFSSVLGPTWPNRMFYFDATSFGRTDNNKTAPPMDAAGNPTMNLFLALDRAKVSWRVYFQHTPPVTPPTPALAAPAQYVDDLPNFLYSENFAADVAAGQLASVTIVEATDLAGSMSPDEGPPGDVELGQHFIGGVIDAVMKSPFWKSSIIFLVYDENGGMYDHVVPPAACAPDDLAPSNGGPVGFDQYGFRVPFIVISPYARRGYVSHVVTDHTSILRFVEARFGLAAMTRRDANATPPYDMLDFDHPDFSVPSLPAVTVTQSPNCP